MAREISLSGGDVSVLKALGLSGGAMSGRALLERIPGMESAELADTLSGLIMMDYVACDMARLRTAEDLKDAHFTVNTAMLRDLREAIAPKKKEVRATRQRRG